MLFKSIKVVKLFKKYLNDLIYSFVKYFAKLLNFRLFTFINNGPTSLFFSKSFIFVNSRLVSNSQDSASTIKWEDLTDVTKNKFLMDGAAGVTKYFFEKTDATEIFYDKKIVNKLLKKVRKNAYFYYGETDKYLYEISNSAMICARSVPARTRPRSARAPKASSSASRISDLPAPVSPVTAIHPLVSSRSTDASVAKFLTFSCKSICLSVETGGYDLIHAFP